MTAHNKDTLRLAKRFTKPRFVKSPDYALQTGGVWQEAFPQCAIGPDRAVRYGKTPDFLSKLDAIVPCVGIIESTSLLVVGKHGWVCSPDGTILADHSWFRGHEEQMKIGYDAFSIKPLPGRAISLMSDWAAGSYGHFIQDLLPRFAILERLGIDLSSFDHIICAAPNEFCLDVLKRLGVDPRRIVEPEHGVAIKPDTLVATTLPGARRSMQPWAIDFVRRRLPQNPQQARRLYITRVTRKPINEDNLIKIASSFGFDIYDPGSDSRNQAQIFAEAEAVIGPEGSAMANLIFCQQSTQVLELLASDHIFPYYFTISMSGKLNYSCMIGKSEAKRKNSSIGASPYSFYIDEDIFARAVSDMVENLPA